MSDINWVDIMGDRIGKIELHNHCLDFGLDVEAEIKKIIIDMFPTPADYPAEYDSAPAYAAAVAPELARQVEAAAEEAHS